MSKPMTAQMLMRATMREELTTHFLAGAQQYPRASAAISGKMISGSRRASEAATIAVIRTRLQAEEMNLLLFIWVFRLVFMRHSFLLWECSVIHSNKHTCITIHVIWRVVKID